MTLEDEKELEALIGGGSSLIGIGIPPSFTNQCCLASCPQNDPLHFTGDRIQWLDSWQQEKLLLSPVTATD